MQLLRNFLAIAILIHNDRNDLRKQHIVLIRIRLSSIQIKPAKQMLFLGCKLYKSKTIAAVTAAPSSRSTSTAASMIASFGTFLIAGISFPPTTTYVIDNFCYCAADKSACQEGMAALFLVSAHFFYPRLHSYDLPDSVCRPDRQFAANIRVCRL